MPDASHISPLESAMRAVLKDRAESLALETAQEETSDQLSLLLFRIADEWYAVYVADVREIFQEYEVTTIPGVPPFILGVVNVRGEILSVTDPARLMGLGSVNTDGAEKPAAIVIVHDGVATAMVVDEIGDIAEIPRGSLEPPVSIIDRVQGEFISGSAHVGQHMVGVVNTTRVLQPVESGGRH